MFERDWIACLKYDNHSRLKSQHNWGGDLFEHYVDEHDDVSFDDEKDIHMSPKNYEESDYNSHLNLLTISY